MKTRVFKKAISVICILSLLMSVCVVSLTGSASAASKSFTFNNAGKVYTQTLNEGDALPSPTAAVSGTTFLGWYDAKFETKYETAGSETNLYAKYSQYVYTFDDGKGIYDPNGKFGNPDTTALGYGLSFAADPDDASNKYIRLNGVTNSRQNFAFASYNGITDSGLLLAPGKYIVNFKFKVSGNKTGSYIDFWLSKQAGIGAVGNKAGASCGFFSLTSATDGWQQGSVTLNLTEAALKENPYILFTIYSADKTFDIGVDDFVFVPVTDEGIEYTVYDKGKVSKMTAKPGSALPEKFSGSFLGWYDSTLTTKFETMPARDTVIVALYDGTDVNFELNGYYDPNKKIGTVSSYSVVEDPTDSSNHVAYVDLKSKANKNFAPTAAEGFSKGLTLKDGQVYTISFDYLAQNVNAGGVYMQFRNSTDAGIGQDGGKSNPFGSFQFTKSSDGWEHAEVQFTYVAAEGKPNFIICLQDGGSATQTATMYLDNIVIAPYVPKIETDDVVMDFENGFKWSVDAANNYTESTGNGYVNRGEIVNVDDDNVFRMKHFRKKNGYVYFTVNSGTSQFEVTKGGIYTVQFDYKVEHSETPSKLGILLAQPTTATTGFQFTDIAVIDEFENREDSDWYTATATFIVSPEQMNGGKTSIGIYLKNSTSVPIEFATSVLFDNVVVKTHSTTGEDFLVLFDSKGGDDVQPMVFKAEGAIDTLPVPTRYGYDFTGWKYDVTEGDVTTTSNLKVGDTFGCGIVNAYATWKLSDGVVEFKFRTNVKDYDETVGTRVTFPGKPIDMPEDPSYEGQTFDGWYYDRAFTKPVDPNSAASESGTIFAKWTSHGQKVTFENYPDAITKEVGKLSDRYKLVEKDGSTVLYHNPQNGTNKSATAQARAQLYTSSNEYVRAYDGTKYTLTFRYKIENFKSSGTFCVFLSSGGNTWSYYKQQTGSFAYSENTDGWVTGTISFVATRADDSKPDHNYVSICVSGQSDAYIDDIVVESSDNEMNIYGSAIRLNTNGGKDIPALSGDPGDEIVLPKPVKNGYLFLGWYSDIELTTPFTDKVFGEEPIMIYAKWQLGKYTESFEDYPASVKQLGVSGGHTFYTNTVAGFDASNVHSGKTSLFRNGTSAGAKNFTLMRGSDLALNKGSTYTLTFYIKPTSIGNNTGTISLAEIPSFTGINNAKVVDTIVKVSDLKEGEWQLVSYTFTANSEFYAIQTTDGNDMYFDDITVTLYGYTGASTGDSSVNPLFIFALVILSAGALLVTGKKVFGK